nr:ARID DNA-binding domain-containing protein [Tanacetum cinerariifolium]
MFNLISYVGLLSGSPDVRLVSKINTTTDYYKILGLGNKCSVRDIKHAYMTKLSIMDHLNKNKTPGSDEAIKKKSLSPGCKEMLLEKMKEIETFNASRVSAKARDHGEGSASTQKEKRARCYICKIREHVFWKCPNKKRKAMSGKQKEIVKPEIKKVVKKVNAYKNHMCLTRPLFKKLKYKFEMIEKEEIKKKFIFSYGVGDVTVEAREGNFVIPYVHYTPQVTLNVLSFDLLEEQGKKYVEMLKWFYLVYLNYDMLEEIPPVIGVMEINLLSLHKIVDSLGAKMPWYEKKPKEDVVESSSGNARVKDPQGKEKDDAGIKEALEEDMNKKTQFGVMLEGNLEEGAEEGSMTDSNDFEVIV